MTSEFTPGQPSPIEPYDPREFELDANRPDHAAVIALSHGDRHLVADELFLDAVAIDFLREGTDPQLYNNTTMKILCSIERRRVQLGLPSRLSESRREE